MTGHQWLYATYIDISVMLGLALVILWPLPRLCGARLRTALARAALCLCGHLRPRPDQVMERALRTAFTQLDEELALALDDRTMRVLVPEQRPGTVAR